MKSRSNVDLQDAAVSLNTNFLPASFDFALDFGGETPAHQETLATSFSDLPATTNEDGSASPAANAGEGPTAASSFALLETQTEAGHPGMDSAPASIIDTSPGSGSINVIGAATQETTAGLHIAPPVDADFTATTDPLFAPAASAPAPIVSINLANLTPMPVEGHGVESVANSETTLAHPASQSGFGMSSDTGTSAASAAGLTYLENSTSGSAVTNTGVGSGGATASQVQAALDESGLSVNGSGIKVGVLSDSFNDLGGAAADEADGALPSTVQVLKDLPGTSGTDEGRAMMQIIHDIAPGASLAFYTADEGEQDFANGIIALANAGAKVIVDDVGYFDEPYFQNGVVAQAIQTVEAEGVTYVTAAGNEASNGYQANFTASSGTFDGVALTNAENFGGSLTQTITINTEDTGNDVPLTLEWNQAYGAVSSSTADLELLIFHNGTLLATATDTNNQFTNEAGNPWTAYDFTSSGTYQIAIENISSSSTDAGLIFKEITWGDGLPATISGANTGTVVGHSMTPGAVTAGAVYVGQTPAFGSNPAISESFSSSGAGTELLFANNGTALSSPDLLNPVVVSGVDGINTTVPGGLSDFFGTSASSASLAGVAALLLSANPILTPADIEAILEQTAASMSNTAVAGAGLAQVDSAVALATQHLAIVGAAPSPALQGGSAVAVTSARPIVNDSAVTLTGATIQITNTSGIALAGDKLFAGGVESGITNGLSVSWNAATDTLMLSGFGTVAQYGFVLNEITFQDSDTDSSTGSHPVRDLTWTINDVNNTYTTTSTIQTDRAPVAVNNVATDTVGATVTATTTSGVLSNATDLDGDHLMVTGVSDTSHGSGTVGTSLAGSYGHLTLNADGSYSYIADNTAAISSGPTGSHLQDVFSYTVSDGNGGTATASLTVTLDRAPVVTASSVTLSTAHAVAASSLFSVADPDGNTITTYAFEDTGSGHFLLNGVVEPNNQEIDVSAAQLSQLTYQSVAGSVDTLEVRVNDGTLWSNWQSFTVTPAVVIQTDGTTALTEAGNNFFLNNTGTDTGPELKQNGVAVTSGEFGTWTPIGAVQVTGGGYDVAWHDTSSGLYTVWSTDSNGNYLSDFIPPASGNSSSVESIETTFNQDLNGDSHIGIQSVVIQTDGTTALTEAGNNFFLNNTGTDTGPELKQNGVAVTSGEFGTWTPIGAVQVTGGGYDVAWHDTSSGLYTVWSTDSNGNYLSDFIPPASGNSSSVESIETTFNQDLNGDSHIGIQSVVIQTDGTTALTEAGNNFFLNNTGTDTGPELKQNGVAVTSGEFGTWTPIGAVQVTGGGYDVAWHDTSSGLYTVWSTDSNGNYLSDFIPPASGNSSSVESIETTFNQDLNGDSHIGIQSVVIQTDGTTALTEAGNNFFLNNTGTDTGPELKQNGVAVTSGEFGTWTPIGAVQVTGGGYDVAWHDTSSGLYTVWSTDSNGNYLSDFIPPASGNSSSVESIETTFNQDLNGDSHIGIPPGSGGSVTVGVHPNSLPEAFQFANASRPIVQNSTMDQTAIPASAAVVTAGPDSFVFGPNRGSVTIENASAMDAVHLGDTAFTSIHHSSFTEAQEDGSGIATDTVHVNWLTHQSDFHFV